MRKFGKNFLFLSAFFVLLSCGQDQYSSTSKRIEDQEETTHADFSLFSTYSTTKVLRNHKEDEARYFNLGENVNIEMMQNEKEGSQIIISLEGEKSVYVDATINELTSSKGEKIPASNISLFYQKYITLPNASTLNPAYSSFDMVPDMLLPFEVAKKHKENKAYGGYNQGITIEIDSKGINPGSYEGYLDLKIGDVKKRINVSVEVWPIKYEGRREFKTSFLIYRNELINGEYDNSKKVVDSYVDFLNDYKTNSYVIQDAGSNNLVDFKNDILRQWGNPNFSSIVIPFDFPQTYMASDESAKRCVSYITTLAKMSTSRENDFIKYAYFYPSSYDEADADPVKAAASERLLKVGGELDKTLESAIRILHSEGYFSSLSDKDFALELEKEIRNIPSIFTNIVFKDEWVGKYHTTFCPYMSLFDDFATKQRYQDASKDMSNSDLWAYSCVGPNYPFATFHIDDDNLDMRVNGWMNKQIGINGYLYYEVNKITLSNDESKLVNPYDDPLRYETTPGDGYLLYPGRLYGLNTPIASNRLSNYRDSMDDYDLLCVLERKLNSYKDKYGIEELSLSSYIGDVYNLLFSGATCTSNDKQFFNARKTVASKIIELDNEDGILLLNEKQEDGLKTVIYSSNSNLNINGKDVSLEKSGQGFKIVLPNNGEITKYNIKSGSSTYIREASGQTLLNDFSSIDSMSKNAATVVEESSGSNQIKVSIGSEYVKEDGKIDSSTMKFTPYIGIPVTTLNKYSSFSFDYSNLSNEDIEFSIGLNNGKSNELIITNYCKANSSRKLVDIDLTSISSYSKKNAKEIRLYFKNVKFDSNGNASLYPARELTISNLVGNKEAK